ncbi:MAG: T9SS type A sorting domain-containing protein [Bacteroidetes bacterium]|nr:T9SS type A sorting domain-containing protein [Bacteroidota bacterium]
MKKAFFISFLLTIVLSTLVNAQNYSGNEFYVLPYKYEQDAKELPNYTNFFSMFGNFGGISPKAVVTSTCAFDKQMCPIDPNSSMARLTDYTGGNNMVGTTLSTVIGGTAYWYFSDSIYPRLRNMPSELPGYVGAAPMFLRVISASDYDTYNNVRHCFHVSNKNGVKWRSKMGRVTIFNSTDNTLGTVRLDGPIGSWDTLEAYYTVTGLDTLKFTSKEIKKTIPIRIMGLNNDCFAEIYTLSLVVQPTGTGYATGGGSYAEGTQVIIEATPEFCYRFVHWRTNSGVVVSNKEIDTITLVSDSTLIAVFEKDTYILSATPDPVGSGTITGTGTYPCDTTAILKAEPADTCYKFSYWQNLTSGEVFYEDSITVLMDKDIIFVANFVLADTFHLELRSDPPAASANLTGGGDYFKCVQNAQIYAQATDNCTVFRYWTNIDGDIISTQNPYTVSLHSDSIIVANFNTSGFNVKLTPSPLDGGTVNGNPSVDTMVCDDKIIIEAEANDGYWFYRWVEADNGDVVSLFAKDTVDVNSGRDLIAEFLKEPVVRVILATKPVNTGKYTGDGSYTQGSSVTITATPISDCSVFRHWEDVAGNIISNQSSYTFIADKDTLLIAVFDIEIFNVSIYSHPTYMGSITGGTTGFHECGAVLNLSAISSIDTIYGFKKWVTGDTAGPTLSTEPEISITILSDTTIIAVFATVGILEDDIYDISIVPNPTDNDFNIVFDNVDNQFISISLMDLTGAKIFDIYEGLASVGKQFYEVNSKTKLPSGSYYIKFVIDGKMVFRSVMVK